MTMRSFGPVLSVLEDELGLEDVQELPIGVVKPLGFEV
jgi:hypothetical protein